MDSCWWGRKPSALHVGKGSTLDGVLEDALLCVPARGKPDSGGVATCPSERTNKDLAVLTPCPLTCPVSGRFRRSLGRVLSSLENSPGLCAAISQQYE